MSRQAPHISHLAEDDRQCDEMYAALGGSSLIAGSAGVKLVAQLVSLGDWA
jgi:hypothetical protein